MPAANPVSRRNTPTGYLPVNGLGMYYEIHGDGSPLVLLHGAMGTLVFAGGTSYRRDGLYPEMLAEPGPTADDLEDSVWHQAYLRVAPNPGAWTTLVAKVNELDRTFAGWRPEDIRAVRTPTLLIIGDSDIVRPEHTVEMFRLLGGGVIGDIAGLPAAQLAVLPGTSHIGLLDRVGWLQSMIFEFLGSPEHG